MKRRRKSSFRFFAQRAWDAVAHNFALKILSLLLALAIYLFLKPNAATTTPVVEKVAKAIAAGAGIESPDAASTNALETAAAPAAEEKNKIDADGND